MLWRCLVRYVKFVIVATAVIFVMLIVGAVVTDLLYRTEHLWSETAVVFLQGALFIAAILGVSRPVFPYIRDPDRPWWR